MAGDVPAQHANGDSHWPNLDELRSVLLGDVFLPGSPDYEAGVAAWHQDPLRGEASARVHGGCLSTPKVSHKHAAAEASETPRAADASWDVGLPEGCQVGSQARLCAQREVWGPLSGVPLGVARHTASRAAT